MLATQKGRSKPVRISCRRSEKVKAAPGLYLWRRWCYVLSRRCTSSADNPATRMTLFRLVSPDAMVTEERGTSKSFAKNSMQASLARPSTGGAIKASFSASPTTPVMAFFLARGWTFTAKDTPADVSRTEIMAFDFTTDSQRTSRHKNRGDRFGSYSFFFSFCVL